MGAVLVTGASSGIGRSIANILNSKGLKVILAGRNKVRLEETQQSLEHPSNSILLPFDISDTESFKLLADELKNQGVSALYGLINNAGIYEPGPVKESTLDQLTTTFNVNFFGPYLLVKAMLPLLEVEPHSIVVNISSTLGNRPLANTSIYSASKAALTSFSKTLALELAPRTRVVSISPGIVDTPIHNFHGQDTKSIGIDDLQPMKRVGTPSDIAHLIDYLVDEKSAWVTGSDFVIDGGISL